jgi:signal transduction histidine kinase
MTVEATPLRDDEDRFGSEIRSFAGWRPRHDPEDADTLFRRQVGHDMRHELSTIMLLAAGLHGSPDLSDESRARVEQIVIETKWLEKLVRALERDGPLEPPTELGRPSVLRVDLLATDILRPIRMSSPAHLILEARAVSVRVDRLGFWRVLRNLIGNAIDAAGPGGRIAVRIHVLDGTAYVDVDDDGPGFAAEKATPSSLGLSIVADLMSTWSGRLTIGRGSLGGCGVRLELPAVEGA